MASQVLCPLSSTPIFQCVGMNYRKHIAEIGLPEEEYPAIFTKPPDALAGPNEDISIHKKCKLMDYEARSLGIPLTSLQAELCSIIGKDCKNVSTEADALSYILGYTADNDVSSRYWQMPERCGSQHGPSKSFDKFAPIGLTILNPAIAHNSPNGLSIKTYVNEELRQNARTDDLIFTVANVICHVSQGTTIMTGTPGGVAAFMKPPQWLNDNDVVVVETEKIGSITNKMVFEEFNK